MTTRARSTQDRRHSRARELPRAPRAPLAAAPKGDARRLSTPNQRWPTNTTRHGRTARTSPRGRDGQRAPGATGAAKGAAPSGAAAPTEHQEERNGAARTSYEPTRRPPTGDRAASAGGNDEVASGPDRGTAARLNVAAHAARCARYPTRADNGRRLVRARREDRLASRRDRDRTRSSRAATLRTDPVERSRKTRRQRAPRAPVQAAATRRKPAGRSPRPRARNRPHQWPARHRRSPKTRAALFLRTANRDRRSVGDTQRVIATGAAARCRSPRRYARRRHSSLALHAHMPPRHLRRRRIRMRSSYATAT